MKISNSKKELARIISENGGWRDGAESAAQCKSDNSISFYRDVPDRDGDCWWGDHLDRRDISQGKLMVSWHQTTLSRAEYFHLYLAPDADGWIEWNGGECPVGDDVIVDVKTRDGEIDTDEGYLWVWSHHQDLCVSSRQIIAYRQHKPEQSKSTAVGDDETNLAAKEELEAMELSEPKEQSALLTISCNPSIEMLSDYYRNKLDYSYRKRDEADKAKIEADAALSELEKAIAAIGFAITPIGAVEQEPELVITDLLDLMVGDVLRCKSVPAGARCKVGDLGVVRRFENHPVYGGVYVEVCGKDWFGEFGVSWEFVSRPAK